MLLTTGRMLYQYNISTRQSPTLDFLAPHEQTEINPADAAAIGVSDGDQHARQLTPRDSGDPERRSPSACLPGSCS